MTREQAINYLFSCGFTQEQVCDVVRALTYKPTTKNEAKYCDRNICLADVNQVIEDYMDEQYHVLSDRTRERAFGANVVKARINELPSVTPQEPCDKCEVGNPCLYCKHEFEPQESEGRNETIS